MFYNDHCFISHHKRRFCSAQLINGLYYLNYSNQTLFISPEKPSASIVCKCYKCTQIRQSNKNQLWHRRLIRTNESSLKEMSNKNVTDNFDYDAKINLELCDDCSKAKAQKLPFKLNQKRVENPLELIHSDVCYVGTKSNGDAKYFVLFIDDATSFIWAYPIQNKGQVFEIFSQWHMQMKQQYPHYDFKRLRSDNGTEYINEKFREYFNLNGLIHENSCPYTPEQNGCTEV